jgi:hypothetical protein
MIHSSKREKVDEEIETEGKVSGIRFPARKLDEK